MKQTPKQLRALKKKFDKLTFADKLKFWDKHFSELNSFYNFHSTVFFDDVEDKERWKPENLISVHPKSKDETEMYNSWILKSIQRHPNYNFEKLKEKYFEAVTNNPRPIEYTEQEIEAIKKHRDNEKKKMEGKGNIRLWGYYFGYLSVVQKKDVTKEIQADTFRSIALQCVKGIADAYYLGFLEKQLEQLKQGIEISPQPKNTSIESIKPIFNPLKLEQIPTNIYSAYFSKDNEPLFHSLQIDGQPIPIFRLVLHLKKTYQPLFNEMHLTEYAKGFTEGVKHEFKPTINTPENIKEMILTEVQNGSQFGFPERVKSIDKWQKHFDKKDVYEYGFRVGKIYKAWGIIFETPKYFEDGFPNRKPDVKNNKEQAEASENKSETNYFCNSMPLNIAREHFKVLTETKSKNGKPFLTVEQFNSFFERAFHGKSELKKQSFNLSTKEKLFIVKRFYQFYLLSVSDEKQYEISSQCQPKYIKLLTDNFTNWTYESIKNNFGNKVKRDW